MKRFISILLFIIVYVPTIMVAQSNSIIEDTLKTQFLDEVIVKSQYQYAKRKGDKFVVSFKGSSFYEGKTITESLALCPLVTREGDSFKVLGKESTIVYIDGRPSTLSGEDLMAFLDTKSVGEIERVEIIAMPSGKFADANKSGVINIVTAPKSQLGTMAMINAGAVKGHNFGGLTNGMFAVNVKDVSINLFANYANQKKTRREESTYAFSSSEHTRELSDFTQHGRPFTTTGSVEWKTRSNLLGGSYTYASLLVDADYNNASSDATIWTKNSNARNHNQTFQLYDDWNIGKNIISFLYSLYDRSNETNDVYWSDEKAKHFDYAKHKINNVKMDVTSKLSDTWELNYGVSANYLRMSSDFSYDDWKNDVHYREDVLKGYLATTNEWRRWTITAGLNFEHTKQDFAGNRKTYNSWLPNVNVSYKSDWGQLYGQFSKTIQRVPYTSLTLSPLYFSPQSITIGNPELKPEESYNVSAGMNRGNLNVELFYKKYENAYMQYSYAENEQIINCFANISDEHQCGMNLSYSHSISTMLLGKVNVSSYYVHSDDEKIGKKHSWNNYLSTSLSIRPDRKRRFDADIRYWALFPQKERGIEWNNRGSFDVDMNYNIIPSMLRLTFSVKDLFNQNFASYSRMYNGVNVACKNTFDNRKVGLTLKLTLSNKKQVGRNSQKSIDEVDRIPTE